MSRKAQTPKMICRSLLAWRNDINRYIESLDGRSVRSEEKAITYAALAIVGLLVFGAVVIGSMMLAN